MAPTRSDLYATTAPYRLPGGPGMPLDYYESPTDPMFLDRPGARRVFNHDAEAILGSHGNTFLVDGGWWPVYGKNLHGQYVCNLNRAVSVHLEFTGPTLLHAIAAAVEAVVKAEGEA